MAKLPHPSALAAAYARSVERQLSQMQGDLRRLRDGNAGVNRAIRAPVPGGGSRYIKGSRTSASIFARAAGAGIGSLLSGLITNGSPNFGGAFYASADQLAASSLDALRNGQRIR